MKRKGRAIIGGVTWAWFIAVAAWLDAGHVINGMGIVWMTYHYTAYSSYACLHGRMVQLITNIACDTVCHHRGNQQGEDGCTCQTPNNGGQNYCAMMWWLGNGGGICGRCQGEREGRGRGRGGGRVGGRKGGGGRGGRNLKEDGEREKEIRVIRVRKGFSLACYQKHSIATLLPW